MFQKPCGALGGGKMPTLRLSRDAVSFPGCHTWAPCAKWSKPQNCLSSPLSGWRSGTEEPSGWVSSEAPLLARSDLFFFFFPCVATWLSLCVCLSKPPLLLRTRVLLDEGPPERLRFTSITSLETLPPSTVASEVLGSGLPRVNCRGLGTTQPLTDTWLCDLRGSTG